MVTRGFDQPHSWEELMDQLRREGAARLLSGESPPDEILWNDPPNDSTHVGAIAWRRNEDEPSGTRNPLGQLLVHYISGGYAPIIYSYDDVPYSIFYYFWRRTPSAGRYTYYTLSRKYDGSPVWYGA